MGCRGGSPPHDEGRCGGEDCGLGTAGGLCTPVLLLGASEVPAALLMASSAQGSAKCAFRPETGKGKKSHGFFFFFKLFLSWCQRKLLILCSRGRAEVPTGAGVEQLDGSIWGDKLQGRGGGTRCSFDLLSLSFFPAPGYKFSFPKPASSHSCFPGGSQREEGSRCLFLGGGDGRGAVLPFLPSEPSSHELRKLRRRMGSLSSNALLWPRSLAPRFCPSLPPEDVSLPWQSLVTDTIATLCCLPVPLFPIPVSQPAGDAFP